MRRFSMLIVLVACKHASSVAPLPDPSTTPLPPPSVPPPKKPDVTRVRGAIEGRYTLSSARVVVGEPIVAKLEVKSTKGPLTLFVGGDQRNEANYPMRVGITVTDANGAVVCDSVDKPELLSFGGIGSDQTFKEGETFVEGAVLDPMCAALAKPGDYRITLHRRLASGSMTILPPAAKVPTSCDVHPVHETAIPAGLPPGCVKQLEDLPSVTTELSLHVDPFDAAKLRASVAARLAESKQDVLHSRIVIWACDWLACSCPKSPSDADVLASLPNTLPPKFPLSCRAAAP
ncbi:MAG: hypothetical protein ACXVEE_18780 [Polyangiales bacterium]